MSVLQTLGTGQGYLKAGFLGFPKSGKTYTATQLLCGVRKQLGLDGPLVMFDTEGGSEYIAPLVKRLTGLDLIGLRSRSFSDLMDAAHECETIGAAGFLIDSITHPWRELCDSYLARINEVLVAKGKEKRTKLELADWNPLKQRWAPWTEWYLNSKMHNAVCGRAGDIWEREENEQTGKMELVKTGVKMKTEGEFGFEPSLLVMMEAHQTQNGARRIIHRATIMGDRFSVLDGAECDNPGYDFFKPHVDLLIPGAYAPIDTDLKTDHEITGEGEAAMYRERRDRTVLCEEIQGELLRAWPGATGPEKKAKTEAIEKAFKTRSWTKVEGMDSATLRAGLEEIRVAVATAIRMPDAGEGE